MSVTTAEQQTGHTATLPPGWQLASLGQLADIIAGQSPPGHTYRKSPQGLPFFQGKADFGPRHPVPRVWCVAPNKIASPGDILISVRAPVGPTNVADRECCIGRGLAAIRVGPQADPDFVLYFLRLFETTLARQGSGSTFGAINRDTLEAITLPVPPLSEQRRVAEKLREQMDAVERATLAAEQQLASSLALVPAYIRDTFETAAWPLHPLGSGLAAIQAGTSVLSLERRAKDDELGVLKVSAISWGTFNGAENKAVPPHYAPKPHELVRSGDLIISRANTAELAGAVVLVRDTLGQRLMLSDKTLRLVPKLEVYLPEFLEFALRTRPARWFIEGNATGTSYSMRNISQDTIRAIPVVTPPVTEQRRSVAVLRHRLGAVERTCAGIRAQLAAIEAMPAALLREAFSGRL